MALNPYVKPPSGKRLFTVVSAMLFISFAFLDHAIAQETQYTNNQADQVLKGSGRVNPSTLGMEMNIPLGSYAGRGLGVPINLSYSSKLWRIQFTNLMPKVNNPGCWSIHRAFYSDNSASGWTNSLAIHTSSIRVRTIFMTRTAVQWAALPHQPVPDSLRMT